MRRSEINAIMRDADAFVWVQGFHLPPFAYRAPKAWQARGNEVHGIVENRLGWDTTDALPLDQSREHHPPGW
jgi:D-lyxose ketol-isomerase